MNRVIPDGALCLFKTVDRNQPNGAINFVISSSILDPSENTNYIIREYLRKKTIDENGEEQEEVHLIPQSNNEAFRKVIINQEEVQNTKIIGEFVKVIYSE